MGVARGGGSISIKGALKVLEVAEHLGADPARVRAEVGLDAGRLADPEGYLPLSVQHRLWEVALEACGDRALPLRVAEACEPATFHVLAYACMTAPTVRAGLERLTRFLSLFLQGETLTLESHPDHARLVLHQSDAPRLGRELSAESTLAKIVIAIRSFLGAGATWAPSEVAFTHRGPADASAHEALFRARVRFGRLRTELVIPTAMLEWPLPKGDPALGSFFERHAQEMLGRLSVDTDATSRVRRAVREAIQSGELTEKQIGRRLGWSERTLRRKLADEGTSFRRVLDEVRRELAQSWLSRSEMAIGEVAFLLGFSESSNFHRAFKRWTGRTPDEFRRSQLPAE
jgi:AraC-like DNA-binding protein